MEKYQQLINELVTELSKTKSINEAIIARNVFIKKHLTPLYEKLKSLPKEEKASFGNEVNQFKNLINIKFDEFSNKLNEQLNETEHAIAANVSIDTVLQTKGALNPITLLIDQIVQFFRKLDFQIVSGNEVTTTKYNFDYLNIPLDHPGRQTSETFYFNEQLMLRAHNTAVTAEMMHKNNQEKDLRILSYGYVYRNDDDDLSHSHQFNQIDLVWIKEGLTTVSLKWLITSLLQYLYGKDVKVRYRLSFFPFTEPSIEADVECPNCHGKGCSLCKKTGWIEIIGAGMLHQKVLSDAGFTIKTGIAAGIGIDRLAMIKYKINDIRHIYSNNFSFLKQFVKENK